MFWESMKDVSLLIELNCMNTNQITVAGLFHIREIFRVLDLMKMDMANFKIDNLRPVLQRQSVEYERANFQSILEKTPSK